VGKRKKKRKGKKRKKKRKATAQIGTNVRASIREGASHEEERK
jgi:hypothetical protein